MTKQDEEVLSALMGERNRPIWPLALLADLVVSVWMFIAIARNPTVVVPPDLALIYPLEALANRAAYVFGYTAGAAIAVWAGAHLLFLSRRTSLVKSLSVLAHVALVAFVVGILAFNLSGRS